MSRVESSKAMYIPTIKFTINNARDIIASYVCSRWQKSKSRGRQNRQSRQRRRENSRKKIMLLNWNKMQTVEASKGKRPFHRISLVFFVLRIATVTGVPLP